MNMKINVNKLKINNLVKIKNISQLKVKIKN